MGRNWSCSLVTLRAHLGGVKGIGLPVIARSEENARAQRLPVGGLQRQRFVELALRLAAPAHLRAGFERQPAIARAIEIELRPDAVEMLRLVAAHHDPLDFAVLRLGGEQRRIEQQRDVRLALNLVVEQQIPQLEAALRIVRPRRRAGTPRSSRPRASRGACRCNPRPRCASSPRSTRSRPAASGPAPEPPSRRGAPPRWPRTRPPCRRPRRTRRTPGPPTSCAVRRQSARPRARAGRCYQRPWKSPGAKARLWPNRRRAPIPCSQRWRRRGRESSCGS